MIPLVPHLSAPPTTKWFKLRSSFREKPIATGRVYHSWSLPSLKPSATSNGSLCSGRNYCGVCTASSLGDILENSKVPDLSSWIRKKFGGNFAFSKLYVISATADARLTAILELL